jgi:hypothetical protein
MRNRRGPYVMILFLVVIGISRLVQTLGVERMSTVRSLGVVSLTGAGFCFGVAFGLLVMLLKAPKDTRVSG